MNILVLNCPYLISGCQYCFQTLARVKSPNIYFFMDLYKEIFILRIKKIQKPYLKCHFYILYFNSRCKDQILQLFCQTEFLLLQWCFQYCHISDGILALRTNFKMHDIKVYTEKRSYSLFRTTICSSYSNLSFYLLLMNQFQLAMVFIPKINHRNSSIINQISFQLMAKSSIYSIFYKCMLAFFILVPFFYFVRAHILNPHQFMILYLHLKVQETSFKKVKNQSTIFEATTPIQCLITYRSFN